MKKEDATIWSNDSDRELLRTTPQGHFYISVGLVDVADLKTLRDAINDALDIKPLEHPLQPGEVPDPLAECDQ